MMEEKRDAPQKTATIVDVGKMANASISTVSRVINHQGGVSPDLEKRILEVVEQLNYRPNSVARALKSKETRLIGVIVPSINNPIFSVNTEHYAAVAEQYGYSLITCSSNSSVDKEVKCLETLIKHQVDGIIFNGMGIYDPRFSIVGEAKVPIVFVGRRMQNFDCDNVTLDNKAGAYQAVTHLIQNGARHIGFFFGYHESVTATDDRFAGYLAALKDNDIPFDDGLVIRTKSAQDDGGRDATRQLLDRMPDLDSIFASNDLMALGCMDQLRQIGIRVPEEISVVGYDGIPYGRLMTPPLSTVITPAKEMAQRTVELLIQRMEEHHGPQKEIVFQPTLYIGGSTRPAPAK